MYISKTNTNWDTVLRCFIAKHDLIYRRNNTIQKLTANTGRKSVEHFSLHYTNLFGPKITFITLKLHVLKTV